MYDHRHDDKLANSESRDYMGVGKHDVLGEEHVYCVIAKQTIVTQLQAVCFVIDDYLSNLYRLQNIGSILEQYHDTVAKC